MKEVIDIDNVIDKAIIKSLEYMCGIKGAKGLIAGAIKNMVQEEFKICNAEEVQSRIRDLHKRGILVEVEWSQSRKDPKKIYALNKNIEFKYVCELLPTEGGSREIPAEIRRHHTVELQEAIKNWIECFPQPSAGYPFDPADRYKDNIRECQAHLLYPDLEKHLPEMGYDICDDWRKYKEELFKLQRMKEGLLSLVEADISKCFKFKLRFISNSDDGINNYECNHIQKVLYNLVLDLSGRIPGQEAHENYENSLMAFREFTKILEGEIIIWEGIEAFIVVPKGERDALVDGIENFKKLLEDVVAMPNLINEGKEIIKKFAQLQKNKYKMINELEESLQYYSFPGECKYLAGY